LPVLKGTGAYSVPKKPAAPGEVPVKALSDEGSTPSISTRRGSVELFFYKNEFALVYRLGDA